MWKYVSRRIRDTFERSVNHFDKRSATGLSNPPNGSLDNDEKNRTSALCQWTQWNKCGQNSRNYNDTKDKRCNFQHLHRSWMNAITWSGAIFVGWYTTHFIHFKNKYYEGTKNKCLYKNNIISIVQPYFIDVKKRSELKIPPLENVVESFTPTVYLASNDEKKANSPPLKSSTVNESSSDKHTFENDLAEVLNSIENQLGLAAIENGKLQDGLNLLRSAANRDHAPALYNLGLCYEMGLGVTIDEKQAMELYRSAAVMQHPGALYNLGIYYGQGRGGLTRNQDIATRLLRLAAIKGQEEAINALKALDIDISEPKLGGTSIDNFCLTKTHSTVLVDFVNFIPTLH